MARPPFSPFKLLTGHQEEIEFFLCTAQEQLALSAAEPEGGYLFRNQIYPYNANTLSKGSSRSDRNVQFLINPPESIGVRYWQATGQTTDRIYGTPTAPQFAAPFITEGVVRFDETGDETITVGEFGQEFAFNAKMTIAVNYHYENELPEPEEGDLVEFWADSWYTLGEFYDVIKVSRTGRIFNTPYWVVWELDLRRNESFVPERRLLSSGGTTPYVVIPEDAVNNALNPSLNIGGAFVPVQKEVTVTTPGTITVPLDTLPVVEDSMLVFVNGLAIKPGEEYVVTNGAQVDILCPLRSGDEVLIFYLAESQNDTLPTFPSGGSSC